MKITRHVSNANLGCTNQSHQSMRVGHPVALSRLGVSASSETLLMSLVLYKSMALKANELLVDALYL